MLVKILAYTPQPEIIIAAAAKLCYSSSDIESLMNGLNFDKTSAFIQKLISLGHDSPFEHVSFTFGIEGVSRSLLAQITRHRIASFSVQSQRYVNKSDFDFIVPQGISQCDEAFAELKKAMENARESYNKIADILIRERSKPLIEQGYDISKAEKAVEKSSFEDARSVLPNACDTKIIMTMNIRSLYNFFNLRCCNRAQLEIRNLAIEMLKQLKEISPILFRHAGPPCIAENCPEGVMTCGKRIEVRKTFLGEAFDND